MAKEIEKPNNGVDLTALVREGDDLPTLAQYENLTEMVSGENSVISEMDFADIRGLLSEDGEAEFFAEFGAIASYGEEIDSGFPYLKKAELHAMGPFRLLAWEFSIRKNLEEGKEPVLTVEAIGKTLADDKPFRLVDSTFGIAHKLYTLSTRRLADPRYQKMDADKRVKAAHMFLVCAGGLSQRPNAKNPTQPRYRLEFRATEA